MRRSVLKRALCSVVAIAMIVSVFTVPAAAVSASTPARLADAVYNALVSGSTDFEIIYTGSSMNDTILRSAVVSAMKREMKTLYTVKNLSYSYYGFSGNWVVRISGVSYNRTEIQGPLWQVSTEEGLERAIMSAMGGFIEQVTIYVPETVTGTNINDFFKKIVNYMENIFASSGNDYAYATLLSYSARAMVPALSTGCFVIFNLSWYETELQRAASFDYASVVADIIFEEGMTDYEKIRAVNSYVAGSTDYYISDDPTVYAPYGVFVNSRAVCQGYAAASYLLLEQAGIQSRIIFGTAGQTANEAAPHAWLLVYISGYWMHFDPTFNDTVVGSEYFSEHYLLLSDASISKDHFYDHEEYSAQKNREVIEARNKYSSGVIEMAVGDTMMTVNGVVMEVDYGRGTTPLLVPDGSVYRTLIPVRALISAMGGTVIWDPEAGMAELFVKGSSVIVWPGYKEFVVDGSLNLFDVAPRLINSRTMLPVRFLVEALNGKVQWIADGEKVIVRY